MTYKLNPWERPQSYFGKSWHNWYVGLGRTRDSGCLDRVNFDVFLEEVQAASDKLDILEPNMGRCGRSMVVDSIQVVRESHWASGWLEWVAIHKYDHGALQRARELFDKINAYPVLDEERWSNEECKEIETYWAESSLRDRIEMCADSDVSIFAARRDYPPEKVFDDLRDGWN